MAQVTFIEMGSGDPQTTSRFFAELFGWTFHAMADEKARGGGWFDASPLTVGLHGGDAEAGATPYIRVEDIEAAIAQVRALGGWAEDFIADEPDFGRFCNCKDPQGLRFGLHEPLDARR